MYNYENWDDYVPVEYNINHEKNGVELKYLHKPPQNTIDRLKRNGWKWNGVSGVWYKTNSGEAQSFAINECSLTQKRKKLIDNMPKYYSDVYIHDDTSYELDIYLSDDTNIHYDGSINDKGVKLFLGMLNTHIIRPDDAEHILRKLDLFEEIDVW